ncbi:RNA polymerase sigma factor [Kribbella italica]|uniref:DNA-directed RNA polymerase specialized sigma24 family protein n=1 Tax=Kribbella italica TaxID=1540520 RepID=A0A7W9J9S1_9ACTN|nr:sigma-70 family RNA polymerase sigma factor [Kribbella italica]MBB5837777.1 DNA-directed RNA polymerase specialized sigma24 family protein [Kribbella italica]
MTDNKENAGRFASECREITLLLGSAESRILTADEEVRLESALRHVRSTLPNLLSWRGGDGLPDPEDTAQEALTAFLRVVKSGRVDAAKSPAGYLVTIALNVVRDHVRRGVPIPLGSPEIVVSDSADVDHAVGLIDRLVSADQVRKALKRAYELNDQTVIEVVHAWLNLAHDASEGPASRDVALVVGVSKSTVAKALARFRGYLQFENR